MGRTVHILPLGSADCSGSQCFNRFEGGEKLYPCAPSNTTRNSGGYLFRKWINVWKPVVERDGTSTLRRRCQSGAHTFCVVLRSGDLAISMLNGLHRRACPEAAVLGVENLEVCSHFRPLPIFRWPCTAADSVDVFEEGAPKRRKL